MNRFASNDERLESFEHKAIIGYLQLAARPLAGG